MAIRENRPIFTKPRQRRAALGPWMLLALLAILAAAGLYVYDQRQTEQVAALRAELGRLKATVDGAAAARRAMAGVASKQIEITGGQLTALWRSIKALQDTASKLETELKAQTARHAQSSASVDARAATMLKDIAALRADMAAILDRLAALEKRAPGSAPVAAPGPGTKPPPTADPKPRP